MKLHRTVKHNPELFNLIPLVNVLFLTVAFCTLARTFVLQPGLSIALPASSFVLSPERHPRIVSITSGALPALYFEDRKVNMKELEAALARSGAAERALIIRADRSAPYEMVSNVMNLGLRLGYSVGVAAAAPQP